MQIRNHTLETADDKTMHKEPRAARLLETMRFAAARWHCRYHAYQMNPLERSLLSLDGISLGDSFGQTFFDTGPAAVQRISAQTLPDATWHITDDSIMASAVHSTLALRGTLTSLSLFLNSCVAINLIHPEDMAPR